MKFNIEILRKNLPEYLHTLQIEYFEKIDSTNTYLLKRKKFDNEILVITDFQTAGRGRFSRSWISNPAENLMFSIGLPSIKVSDLSKLSFLVPLSIQESIAEVLELNLFIKWPNDLIIDNKKVCGILIETLIENNENAKVVIGIGINVNQVEFPAEIKMRAISLRAITNKMISRELLLAKIISKIFEYLNSLPYNFEMIYEKYKNKCTGLGKKISLLFNDKIYSGLLNDINKSGELELLIGDQKLTFNSGEITILKE